MEDLFLMSTWITLSIRMCLQPQVICTGCCSEDLGLSLPLRPGTVSFPHAHTLYTVDLLCDARLGSCPLWALLSPLM